MSRTGKFSYFTLPALLLALCLGATWAYAHDDDDEDEGRHRRHEHREHSEGQRDRHASNVSNVSNVSNAALKEECGSCHIVYPPNMLGAESWRELMAHLNKHFGTDASLDNVTQRELSALLQNQAGDYSAGRSGRPALRISETAWFEREHDEVSPRTWRNPKVKSPSNCAACHTQAAQGRFNEREIRMPR